MGKGHAVLVPVAPPQRTVMPTAIHWALYAMRAGLTFKTPVPPAPPSFAS